MGLRHWLFGSHKKLPWLPRGMNNRWWQFRLIDVIVSLLRSRQPKHGLVIVRMDGLGDMILFRPLLDYYAEAFGVQQQDITILGCNSWRGLAATVFAGYRVVTINEHAYERRFWYRLKISLWMAQQNFKQATCDIYFRKTMACDSLLYYSYADEVVVCEPYPSPKTKPRFAYYRHLYTRVIDTGPHPRHETLRHYQFVSQLLGRELAVKPLFIPWTAKSKRLVERPYVAFNFGSNEAGRRWPFASFIAVANKIMARGYHAVFLGGPAEMAYRDLLDQQCQHPLLVNYIGKDKGLTEVLDILKNAHAVITSETGPGHFALALQVPTLMICGGTADVLFVPYPQEICATTMRFAQVYRDCFGCLEHCPYRQDDTQPFPCLADVTVEQVWQQVEDWMPQCVVQPPSLVVETR